MGPKLRLSALEDRHSLKSVDSGIPTLEEIGNPEPVPCSVVHVRRKPSESEKSSLKPRLPERLPAALLAPPRPPPSAEAGAEKRAQALPRSPGQATTR